MIPHNADYLLDMSSVLTHKLREEYSDPEFHSDGETFRQIRFCQQSGKIFQEMKWWACLTSEKVKDLKRILAAKELREDLDKLLDIKGLWDGFQIEAMRRYMGLKCHEVMKDFQESLVHADKIQELSTYLRHICHVWSKVISSNSRLMNLVDAGTVRKMEQRAPAASEHHTSFLRTCMKTGKIFAQVLDPRTRRTIIDSICAVDRLIPSLWTFFEDIERLAPCARAVRMLLDMQDESTTYKALRAICLVSIVINPNQPRMRARGKSVNEPMEQRAIVASMTSSRWLPQPYHKTRQQVETQCCRSRLPSVSAANEEDETWSDGRKWSLHRRERGRPGMQLRALNQLQRNIALLATPSFWTGLVVEAQCSSSSRALVTENREGRERSIDGPKLDRRVRRTGSEGQVASGLTRRVGEHRSIIMRKQRGMSKGLNNRLDIPSNNALPDQDLVWPPLLGSVR